MTTPAAEPLSPRGLAAMGDLSLEVVVEGGERFDAVIGSIFTSELPDPTTQMQGGEFVLTTGHAQPDTPRVWAEYVDRLLAAGCTGIGFGVGDDVAHREVPEGLIAAARAAQLPLLVVPQSTSFLSVTKRFYHEREEQEKGKLRQSIGLYHRLTAAAGSRNGIDSVARTWRRETGSESLVLDRMGGILHRTEGFPPEALEAVSAAVQNRTLRVGANLRLPAGEGGSLRLFALGGPRLRGYLAVAVPDGPLIQESLPSLVALVTLELELYWLGQAPVRRERAGKFLRLLNVESDAAGDRYLRSIGHEAAMVWGVAVAVPSDAGEEVQEDLAVALGTDLVRTRDNIVEAFAFSEPRAALESLQSPELPTGIGAPTTLGKSVQTLHQALLALEQSRRTGGIAAFVDGTSHQILLQIARPEHLNAFADSVLGLLERAPYSAQLLETLEVWLAEECSLSATSTRLGLHRHTVRDRLDRVGEILGRELNSIDARTEIWLALKARGGSGGR